MRPALVAVVIAFTALTVILILAATLLDLGAPRNEDRA